MSGELTADDWAYLERQAREAEFEQALEEAQRREDEDAGSRNLTQRVGNAKPLQTPGESSRAALSDLPVGPRTEGEMVEP